MAKADVLQLVADLSDSLADQTACSSTYDDLVYQLALSKNESLTNASFVQSTAGTAQYSYPTTAIRILGVLFDTNHLEPSDVMEAQAYDAEWRANRGDPRVWLLEQESRRTFTLVPVPNMTGATVGVTTPFTGFPEGNSLVLYNEFRANVHAWEELVMALEILVQEFSRDSDHTDAEFAKACAELSKGFKALIGWA